MVVCKVSNRIKTIFYNVIKIVSKKKMIVDVTGTVLIPGNKWENCLGNGEHINWRGKYIECCCDECDYMMCCGDSFDMSECKNCNDPECPNAQMRI